MSKKETMEEMRERLRREKESARQNYQKEVVSHLTHEDTSPDFTKIAEELQRRHEEEKASLNDGFIKDTIYIQEDIYRAFNALCTARGDKKKYANQALAEFVEKRYREIQAEKAQK